MATNEDRFIIIRRTWIEGGGGDVTYWLGYDRDFGGHFWCAGISFAVKMSKKDAEDILTILSTQMNRNTVQYHKIDENNIKFTGHTRYDGKSIFITFSIVKQEV